MEAFVRYGQWIALAAFPFLLTAAAIHADIQYGILFVFYGGFLAVVFAIPPTVRMITTRRRGWRLSTPLVWVTVAFWVVVGLLVVAVAISQPTLRLEWEPPPDPTLDAISTTLIRVAYPTVPVLWLAQLVLAFFQRPPAPAFTSTAGQSYVPGMPK